MLTFCNHEKDQTKSNLYTMTLKYPIKILCKDSSTAMESQVW